MSHRRSTTSTILEVLSLNPMPYPVLLIFAVLFIFLGFQWFVSYEDMVENTEASMGWLIMAVPLVLIFAVRWLSSIENPESLFGWNQRRRTYYAPSEGSSPWGVAALIVVVLVMLQYQSSFLDSWFV